MLVLHHTIYHPTNAILHVLSHYIPQYLAYAEPANAQHAPTTLITAQPAPRPNPTCTTTTATSTVHPAYIQTHPKYAPAVQPTVGHAVVLVYA